MPAVKKRILVIEDEKDIADLIQMILQENYVVHTVLDPRNAMTEANEFKPNAILLDLAMPLVSGWEVFKSFRNNTQFATTPIAIVTAKAEDFDAIIGLHVMRANAYITKPFGKQELTNKVMDLLNEK